jgi:hypothetical protein
MKILHTCQFIRMAQICQRSQAEVRSNRENINHMWRSGVRSHIEIRNYMSFTKVVDTNTQIIISINKYQSTILVLIQHTKFRFKNKNAHNIQIYSVETNGKNILFT